MASTANIVGIQNKCWLDQLDCGCYRAQEPKDYRAEGGQEEIRIPGDVSYGMDKPLSKR